MSHDSHIHPIGEHVHRQHQDLHELMCTIGRLLSHHPDENSLEHFMIQGRLFLKELRHKLADHFIREERGGYLEEAVGRVPRLATCVALLEKQHPELLADIDQIISIAAIQPAMREQWLQTALQFSRFSQVLLKHEEIEEWILQQGFNDELGLECDKPLAKDEA